jgi:adenylosuccinate synthase
MPVVAVVGAQWGDEGKGKVVDLYARHADVVVRYGGGANAGHTLVVGGDKVVLHLVPSGALHAGVRCVVGAGTVVDPPLLRDEIAFLRDRSLMTPDKVALSDRAHLVLPHHKQVDELRERGDGAIGTTKRGIGPAYEDKVARRGVRAGDLRSPDRLEAKIGATMGAWRPVVEALGGDPLDPREVARDLLEVGASLLPYVRDTSRMLADDVAAGRRVLLEGAQGTLLDVDHGTYPYVTSSTVVSGGACAGAGIPPTHFDRVVGITKAYTTRVGGGPFPTQLDGPEGDRLREAGAEYGATTGRPRRCGWLDIPALRFAARINGMGALALTKLDILAQVGDPKLCTAYELDGERLDEPPFDGLDRARPVYETLPGWTEDLSACASRADLPGAAQRYVARIEELIGCPVEIIGVGPGREQTLGPSDPFA